MRFTEKGSFSRPVQLLAVIIGVHASHKGRLRMLHIYSLSISALGHFLRILKIDGGCCKHSLHFDPGSFSADIDDPANLRHLHTGMLQAEPIVQTKGHFPLLPIPIKNN